MGHDVSISRAGNPADLLTTAFAVTFKTVVAVV
jgi:hypothetical protein